MQNHYVGTWPKCILFLSLPPRWRVCLFLSYPLFWPSPVSVCSSNRTKDHAIAESDRSDRTNTELKRLTSLESLFAAELQQWWQRRDPEFPQSLMSRDLTVFRFAVSSSGKFGHLGSAILLARSRLFVAVPIVSSFSFWLSE